MSDLIGGGSSDASAQNEAALDEQLLEDLGSAAAEITGFSREAINLDALRRSARELLAIWSRDELFSRVHMRDAQVAHALRQAVSVGETYFFRQPEHFNFIAETLVPDWMARKVASVRAWSAGCATGEEPFSIAAFLQSTMSQAPEITIQVLGTDLLKRNLTVARAATYGAWSQRASAPMLAPVVRPLEGPPGAPPLVRVIDRVRAAVRFAEHNLLQPIGDGPFDLILCRNVLVYFAPKAAQIALANLSDALAPGGALMLGSMDLNVPSPELAREGQAESLIFRKAPRPTGPKPTTAPTLRSLPNEPDDRTPAAGLRALPSEPAQKTPSGPKLQALPSEPNPRAPSGPNLRAVPDESGQRTPSGPVLRALPSEPGPRAPSGPVLQAFTSGSGVRRISQEEASLLHLRALSHIERGELDAAEQALRTVVHGAPDYLPGLFERALMHQRRGEPAAGMALMREVHRRASLLARDALVLGPEPLDARFYVESAEAFLRGPGGRG